MKTIETKFGADAERVLACIRERRSIRKFFPEQIDEEKLEAVLEAGLYAPSGHGEQSPVLVAVQSPREREILSRMNAEVMGTGADPYYGAPAVIVVLAPASCGTAVADGSCALENMMLAAHALGLGSCWINREREMFSSPEGKELLRSWNLPEELAGIGAIALGIPAGASAPAAERREGRIVRRK